MPDPRPTATVCPACGRLVNASVRRCPHCGRVAPNLLGAGAWLDRFFQGRRSMCQWITLVTLLVTGAVFTNTALVEGPAALLSSNGVHPWNRVASLWPEAVLRHGEVWRVFTWLFVHGSLLHVGFNMLVLMWLGPQVEVVYGRARLVLIYFGCGLGAAFASLLKDSGMGVPSVGASGAIAGLLGVLISYGLRRRDAVGRQLATRLLILLGLNAVLALPGGAMLDHYAHVGGLLTGFVLGRIIRTRDQTRRGEGPGVRLAAVVTLALVTLSLGASAWQLTGSEPARGPDPVLAQNWSKFMSNLRLIRDYSAYHDRGEKAENSRKMAAFRAEFQEEAERMGPEGDWLRALLDEWKELNEMLDRAADPEALRRKASDILEHMTAAPAPWAAPRD